MEIDIYEHLSISSFVSSLIKRNRAIHGYQSHLARVLKCNRSFISQIVNGKSKLTADHAYKLSEFLNLEPETTAYLLDLTHLERCQSEELRLFYLEKLQSQAKGTTASSSNIDIGKDEFNSI